MSSKAHQPWGRRRLIAELRAAVADPARIGDGPMLESALSGQRASPAIEAQLGAVRGYHPPLDLNALAALPASTFGAAYARFLQSNGLRPIVLSGRLPPELVAENAFVARYGTIHDIVHALLGFEASWPGEDGVWAYVGAQGYSPMFRLAGWSALAQISLPVGLPIVVTIDPDAAGARYHAQIAAALPGRRLAQWAKEQHGTWAAAAEALGCDEKTLRQDAALVDDVGE